MASMPGARWIKSEAERLGISPSKRLGQNFMTDPHFSAHISALAPICGTGRVLEIGPGFGSLTLPLLKRGFEVKCVELDSRLSTALPNTVSHFCPGCADRFSCLNKDALRLCQEDLEWEGDFSLVSNLPYSTGIPILINLLSVFPNLKAFLVLLQKEEGERLCAKTGNKRYGIPTLKLNWFGESKIMEKVPRTVFWPVPHVDSVLVEFKRKEKPQDLKEAVFSLVDEAFSSRRKMIKNSLSRVPLEVLEEAGLQFSRPENLSIQDFERLASLIS